MRKVIGFIMLFLVTILSFAGGNRDNTLDAQISARGAIGRLETTDSPMFTGDGGKNIRLAILAPEAIGDVPDYLPLYIQGLLNNNFSKYSDIALIDRQNLNRIISEQNIAAGGRYSDRDFIAIGNLVNAQFFLFGSIQRLPGNRVSLQLSITDSNTGVRRASSMKDGFFMDLEGRGTLINEATADLLTQMGVVLTETGRQALLQGNISAVQSEAGLARGITAQAAGLPIEALFNYTQSISFDPSQMEALSRLNVLSSTISGGTISQRILNDIEARNQWLEVFKETTEFFNKHPPFEIIFDPNLIQIGTTNYVRRTADIGMNILLRPSKAGFDTLNALLEGLEKTGRRDTWGFSGWPLHDINPRTRGTVVFNRNTSFSYRVDVALVNENGKTIATNNITLRTDEIIFYAGDGFVQPPVGFFGIVQFRNIRAEDLTPTLIIEIRSVNGISSRELNDSGYMRISHGDLETTFIEIEQSRLQLHHLNRGNEAIRRRDWNTAIREFTEAIRLNPDDARAYNGRGRALRNQNIFDPDNNNRAIIDFTEAIRLNPNYAEAYYNRGEIYGMWRGGEEIDDNRAISDFTQAIRLNPNYTNAYLDRAWIHHRRDDFTRAISDYEAVLRIIPDHYQAEHLLDLARRRRPLHEHSLF